MRERALIREHGADPDKRMPEAMVAFFKKMDENPEEAMASLPLDVDGE